MRYKSKHTTPTLFAAAALAFAASSVQAGQTMTNATFSAAVDNQRELLTFKQNSSGFTFGIVAIGTTTADGGKGWHLGPGNTTGEPASGTVAMSDDYVTTNAFGTPDNSDFLFGGTTVNDGDGQIFYLVEHLGNDTTLIEPLDATGNVIAGWSFTIVPGDYGAITDATIYDWNNEGNNLAGTTFSLTDFSGTGTLTGVGGLRIDGGGALDLAQTGVAVAIPEPSAALLVGALGMLGLLRRRR